MNTESTECAPREKVKVRDRSRWFSWPAQVVSRAHCRGPKFQFCFSAQLINTVLIFNFISISLCFSLKFNVKKKNSKVKAKLKHAKV